MAFIHTNFLTGNDTTGDGSTGLPYKTVSKALTVAVSNDFIKVAGGQWTAVSGDFTFTNSSVTVNTSTSQVGIIAVNDVLTFEDGQFGFDKFHVRVTAVAASTLTLSTAWTGPTQITSALYMINQFHYTTASGINFENWVSSNVTPNGRTGITVSGGWSSDYTTQNGWTMIRATQATPSGVNFANITGSGVIGAWGNNLVFDRLFLCRANSLFLVNATGVQSNSFAFKEYAVIRGDSNGIFINNPSARWGGLYNVDSNTPVTIYICTEQAAGSFSNMNAINVNNPARSSSTNITVYQQAGATTTGGSTVGALACSVVNTATQASANKITMHVRTSYVASGTGLFNAGMPAASSYGLGTAGAGSFYLQKGYIYCNAPTFMTIYSGINYYTQVEDLEFVGPFSSYKNALALGFTGVSLIDLSDEGKTVEDFNPTQSYSYGPTGAGFDFSDAYNLQRLCQTNLSATQVKDSEGLKTLDSYMNIYFKDQVNNWLRITGAATWGNDAFNVVFTWPIWKLIGVKEKVNTPFTVTVRLKTDDAAGIWDQIALQYGPNMNQKIVTNITPTSSFADYYITVDPTTYSDWNQFIWPMYIGLRSKVWNSNSNNQQAPICYVESINIS